MSTMLDVFRWQHRVLEEPLDLVWRKCWRGLCPMAADFGCDQCGRPATQVWEMRLQWGDTDAYEHIDSLCSSCMRRLFGLCRNTASIRDVCNDQNTAQQ